MLNRVLPALLTGMLILTLGAVMAMGETVGSITVVPASDYYSDNSAPPSPPATSVKTLEAPASAPCSDACAPACDCGCENVCTCHTRGCFPLFKFDDFDSSDCGCEEARQMFGNCCLLQDRQTTVTGWVDGGIMGNSQNPPGHFNGPVTYPDLDNGQLNQLYLSIERTAAKDNCGFFFGGRIDLLYGSDYVFTTAAGLDGTPNGNIPRWGNSEFTYGLSMPQVYGEVDYDSLKIQLGHFYSFIGYEVPEATGNFFYTHSYAMQYGEPHTLTGGIASNTICDNWTWHAGIVNGWNEFGGTSSGGTVLGGFVTPFNSTGNGQSGGDPEFVGGLTYCCPCWGSVAFAIISGNDSTVNQPGIGPYANRTMFSLVWTRYVTNRLTYVLQYDDGFQNNASTFAGTSTARWYSIDQYLYYKLNNCWSVGARAEWFYDGDGFAVMGQRPGNPLIGSFFGGNFFETTLGLNYKPNANLTIRPEVRYDSYSPTSTAIGSQLPFNNTTSQHQFLFGLDAILQF